MTVPMQSVRADATTYSTTRRQFKVGILLVDSTAVGNTGPENPDPFVFHIAEERKDLKPQNWEFVNPLAPGVVTTDIRERWLQRDPNQPYQLGQKITKNMAAYWEVSLTKATIQELVQYDLLYVHSHRRVGFTPTDREKLRKLVDAGGVIWMENCGGMYIESLKPFFLEQLQFRTNNVNGNHQPVIYQPDHPILNSPYQMSVEEIRGLGENKITRGFYLSTIDLANPANINGLPQAPNPETLITIVGTTAANDSVTGLRMPFMMAGNYGSGAIIATAGDTGCDINDRCGGTFTGSGGNSGAYSGTNLDAAQNEDLKFLYNMVAWGSQSTTDRRNNRRTASSFDSVGAPLVTNFNFDNTFTRIVRPNDVVNSQSAPLIVKNALFVVGKDANNASTIRCYDTQPFSDLDGDGNFDDGLPDISIGLPYDEVWRWDGPAGPATALPSAPVYGAVRLPNGLHEDRISVSLADGTLILLRALPKGTVSLLPVPSVVQIIPGGGAYTPDVPAPAPVFHENRLYQVMPDGLLRCMSAVDGTVLFTSFQNAPYTMVPMGTPTLGIVRQTGQGTFPDGSNETTNDVMLYVPTLVTDSGNTIGRVIAYWLGTRNEVQRNFASGADGQNGYINTRVAAGQGGPGAGWYYVAAGQSAVTDFRRPLTPQNPFVRPTVRVYSALYDANGVVTSSAKEQYALGNESPYYQVVRDDDTPVPPAESPIRPDGRVKLIKLGSAPAVVPNAQAGRGAEILISVDYDIVYIPNGGNPPPNYAQNQTQIGARPNNVLNIPFIVQPQPPILNSLFTSTLAPDDSLIYTTLQQWTNSNVAPPPFASIQAINEQEGDASGSTSRLRWKYNFFDGFTNTQAPDDLLFAATVDNVTVADVVPLTNRLQFDAGWPQASQAIKRVQGEALRNVRIVGSPVATNDGITYAIASATSAYNGAVTVLMAFKTNPSITLTVPEPFDEAAGVTVSQVDLLSDPSNPATIAASSNRAIGPNFTLDGNNARITLTNFRVGGKSFSASQSFVVRYTRRQTREERRVVVPPIPLAVGNTFGLPTDATGQVTVASSGFTPLLYYYVLPGTPSPNASPTLMGEYIYYPMVLPNGGIHMVAVDARPQDNDPKVRPGFGEQVFQVTASYIDEANPGTPVNNLTNHVRMAQRVRNLPGAAIASSMVGGQGTLALNTTAGTFTYELGTTLIADSKRILEAGADGAALWSMDASVDRTLGGGEEPIFDPSLPPPGIVNPPATGARQTLRKAFARPNVARKVASSDYLIADTGNNRVIRTDRGGTVRWSLARFEDPYGLLASGEQTTLNGPTDVQFYVAPTIGPGGQTGYEIHYLIADAGNFRIIEVADYYNLGGEAIAAPNTSLAPGDHVLLWTTRTASEGKRYRFQSLQRFLGFGPAGSQQAGFYGYPYVSAIVSNSTVGTGSSDSASDFTGGAIVNLSYMPYNTTLALNNGNTQVSVPPLWAGANPRVNEPIGNGTVLQTVESVNIIQGGNILRKKRISAPIFFQQINLPPRPNIPQRTLFLICDAEGAYVVESEVDGNTGKLVNNVLWMFTQADYDRINGVSPGTAYTDPLTGNLIPAASAPARGTVLPGGRLNIPPASAGDMGILPRFQPSSIQLLPSGNYLITNSWAGRSPLFESGQFNGEVIEVDPAGLSVLIDTNFGDTRIGGTFASFAVPSILKGATGLTLTGSQSVGLNQQLMGNPRSNTGLLEQPLFSVRP